MIDIIKWLVDSRDFKSIAIIAPPGYGKIWCIRQVFPNAVQISIEENTTAVELIDALNKNSGKVILFDIRTRRIPPEVTAAIVAAMEGSLYYTDMARNLTAIVEKVIISSSFKLPQVITSRAFLIKPPLYEGFSTP